MPGSAIKAAMRAACVVTLAVSLGACGSWFGESSGPPLPGERVAVLPTETSLEADAQAAGTPFVLPAATFDGWAQDGGNARHDPQRLAGSGVLNVAWEADIGSGSDSTQKILVQPIVGGSRIFTVDADGLLRALDASGGGVLWELEIVPEDEDEAELGGGVAYADGTLFVTTGAAEAMAIEPATGAVIWRAQLPGPSRSAPTIDGGRVFAVTADNRAVALDAATGNRLWSHAGAEDQAGLLGSASPAVDGSVVVVPYTSGEVYVMRVENGRVLWSDRLAAPRRIDALAQIAHIRARPIISGDRLYIVSHSGRTAALDMRTGARVWEQTVGGATSPWLASDTLFVIGAAAEVVALSASDGRVRWVTQLPAFEDPEDREDAIGWVGPILVGDRLLAASSTGMAVTLSPDTGEIIAQREVSSAPIRIEPLAANGTVYLLSDDATLLALR